MFGRGCGRPTLVVGVSKSHAPKDNDGVLAPPIAQATFDKFHVIAHASHALGGPTRRLRIKPGFERVLIEELDRRPVGEP